MDYFLQSLVVFIVAISTFFSGFGLGTIMLPVLMISYETEIAILATAIIHVSNNILKFVLLKKHIDYTVFLKIGITSAVFALIGASFLHYLSGLTGLLNSILGVLIILFALIELNPKQILGTISGSYLWIGGALSGLFGGVSGHQGAIRSAFLVKSGLSKASYIATGTAVSLLVDFSRIPIYLDMDKVLNRLDSEFVLHLSTLVVAALTGTFIGRKYLEKTTKQTVQIVVAIFLLLFGVYMIIG